jgi:hypothetical protein
MRATRTTASNAGIAKVWRGCFEGATGGDFQEINSHRLNIFMGILRKESLNFFGTVVSLIKIFSYILIKLLRD